MIRRIIIIAVLLAGTTSVLAQEQLQIVRPPETTSNLIALSSIMGAAHYLNVVCAGRNHQSWRDRMVELLEIESPAYSLRGRLIAAFNEGYQVEQHHFPDCSKQVKQQLQSVSKQGRILSDSLADPYLR